MTDAYLYKSRGNDLVTGPEYNLPGLRAGDRRRLRALRQEAMEHHCAPPVILESCDFQL